MQIKRSVVKRGLPGFIDCSEPPERIYLLFLLIKSFWVVVSVEISKYFWNLIGIMG